MDQHQLLALIAPRPVLINAMSLDTWADPRGMFDTMVAAYGVWAFLAMAQAPKDRFSAESPVLRRLQYQLRPGKHEVNEDDWGTFVRFAQRHVPCNQVTPEIGA